MQSMLEGSAALAGQTQSWLPLLYRELMRGHRLRSADVRLTGLPARCNWPTTGQRQRLKARAHLGVRVGLAWPRNDANVVALFTPIPIHGLFKRKIER